MNHLLFGYGSLVSFESAEKTLGRRLHHEGVQTAKLHGYVRSWNANIEVAMTGTETIKTAGFLNLRKEQNSCVGAVFEVTQDELERMDIRETGYLRTKVRVEVESAFEDAYTYIFRSEAPSCGSVLSSYLDIVNRALNTKGSEFRRLFWASTDPIPPRTIDGEYKFQSPIQNELTGR